MITQASIDAAIEKARIKNSAAGVTDVTNGAVANKLAKMFAEQEFVGELQDIAKGKTFAQMGIGQYL